MVRPVHQCNVIDPFDISFTVVDIDSARHGMMIVISSVDHPSLYLKAWHVGHESVPCSYYTTTSDVLYLYPTTIIHTHTFDTFLHLVHIAQARALFWCAFCRSIFWIL